MNQLTYSFSKMKLGEAAMCVQEAPTVYEGLSNAFLHALKWIDPERDMPPKLRSLMWEILNDLQFQGVGDGNPPRIHENSGWRPATQMLDPHDAEDLAARLTTLWELISAYPQEGDAPPGETRSECS